MATLMIEKESKPSKSNGNTKTVDTNLNESVNETKDNNQQQHHQEPTADSRDQDGQSQINAQRPRVTDVGILAEPNMDYGDDDIKFIDDDRLTKEFSSLRNQFRKPNGYRDVETTTRDRFRDERDDGRAFYHHSHEMNIRPSDEVDTPRFSSIRDNLSEARFPKVVNSTVKSSRLAHDDQDNFDNHGR